MFRLKGLGMKTCLAVLVAVLIITVLAGCERNRGWKALTGNGEYWDVFVTVQFNDGVWSEMVWARYLGEEKFVGNCVTISGSIMNGSMSHRSTGKLDRLIDVNSDYQENQYFKWRHIDEKYKTAQFYITWSVDGELMSETVTVDEG